MRLGTIAFLLGVVALQQLAELPNIYWCFLLVLFIPVSIWFQSLRFPVLVCIGFIWALLQSSLVYDKIITPDQEGINLHTEGIIYSIPEQQDRSVRFLYKIDKSSGSTTLNNLPIIVRLNWYGKTPNLQAGQRWQLTIRLKRPNGFMNPGGFDYEKWLFQQRISAVGYVRTKAVNKNLSEDHEPITFLWLRQQVSNKLDRLLEGKNNLGVIQALSIGERKKMDAQQWKLLTATGTNHLIAISGLHIGLVAGLIYFLAFRIWALSFRLTSFWSAPKAAAVASIMSAFTYAMLAGFAIPTQRALIMIIVVMGSMLVNRSIQKSRTLALALLMVLIYDPLSVLSAGFWLSFTAVTVILFAMSGRIGNTGIWWKWGRVQWVIAIGLLPLSLLFFQRVSLIAPVANIVVVPWVSFLVVPFVLLAITVSTINENLSSILLEFANWQLDRIWQLLEYLATIPMAQWSYSLASLWILIPVLIAAVLLLVPRGFPARNLAGIFVMPLFLVQSAIPDKGEVWLNLLDVGQGLATVVQTRNHVLVYDVGPKFSDTFNTGAAVVIPFLRHAGIDKIDMLVISHGDNDHIGGAQDLTTLMPVKHIFSGELDKVDWAPAMSCIAGESWNWDGIDFQFIHPPKTGKFRRNDRSCVLRIQGPGGSILLTGDIHRKSEKYLLKAHKSLLDTDVLVAPHHGSKTSSSSDFVKVVSPKIVLFPAGYRSRFGHPRKEVVSRYKEIGSSIYDSATHGAISIKISPKTGISTPRAYRFAEKRYWNRQ